MQLPPLVMNIDTDAKTVALAWRDDHSQGMAELHPALLATMQQQLQKGLVLAAASLVKTPDATARDLMQTIHIAKTE